MSRILRTLAANSRRALDDGVYDMVEPHARSARLTGAIARAPRAAIIAEIKYASPSEGNIRGAGEPGTIAAEMAAGGAAAVSVLTQPHLFGGSPATLAAVRRAVGIPVIMKDIVVSSAQVEAGARMGADCILLIQAVFDMGLAEDAQERLISLAHGSGMEVIVEAHTSSELDAAESTRADALGVNNRDLDTMRVDTSTLCRLMRGRERRGARPVISESGISDPADIAAMRACGADAFLVGTSLMRRQDISEAVRRLADSV